VPRKNNQDRVVHPLFDKPEDKRDPDRVGPMEMTRTVRYSLIALRLYLIAMIVLAVYRTMVLAGLLSR
jgi:hypothetical protein